MSRALSWQERRERLLEKAHRRVVHARKNGRCARVVPSFARFEFQCGHQNCTKAFGHRGKHGAADE